MVFIPVQNLSHSLNSRRTTKDCLLQKGGRGVDAAVWRWVEGSGLRVKLQEFGGWGVGFRVQGSGRGISGLGCRVEGLGFRVQGLGFRV